MATEILIIDDNADIRNILDELIQDAGYKTRLAANFNQGLSEIDKKLPDVAIIDVKLALSKDYYTISTKKKWITNEQSRRLSHFLRTQYNALVSTSKSINNEIIWSFNIWLASSMIISNLIFLFIKFLSKDILSELSKKKFFTLSDLYKYISGLMSAPKIFEFLK